MAESNKPPGSSPVRVYFYSRNVEEGAEEIGRRARALAQMTVESGKPVDPADLRRLGPDGERYYFKCLRNLIAEGVPQAPANENGGAQTVPGGQEMTPNRAASPPKPNKQADKSQKAPLAAAGKPSSAKEDSTGGDKPTKQNIKLQGQNWKRQQKPKLSSQARARRLGLIVGVVLAALVAIHLGLLPMP
jgi:hypothetical protein